MSQKQDAARSLEIVASFYAAKERHDLDAVIADFADDIYYVFPLAANGEPAPWFVHDGREAVVEYQRALLENFPQIRMLDQELTVSADGDVVFASSRGDYKTQDGTAYTNVYLFRFELANDQIVRVTEYCNPVTYAKLAGLPIG
jgi:ketosteroid isomerase-like protein